MLSSLPMIMSSHHGMANNSASGSTHSGPILSDKYPATGDAVCMEVSLEYYIRLVDEHSNEGARPATKTTPA